MHHFLENRHKLNLFFSSLFLLVLFPSCEESLNIEVPKQAPLLTVNCILIAGDTIKMEITSSQPYPPLIDSSLTINNAIVKLFEDDIYFGDLVYKEYKKPTFFLNEVRYHYALNGSIPGLDHSYSINVTAPGFTEISSSTSIPQPVHIISVDTNTVFLKNGKYTYKTLECTIIFKDTPGIKNWYKLHIFRPGLYNDCLGYGPPPPDCKTSMIKYPVPFYCYDLNAIYFRKGPDSPGAIVPEEEYEKPELYDVYLADDSFDGITYELKVLIPLPLHEIALPPVHGDKFIFRKLNFILYSINKEYFKYASSYYTQRFKKNDMFSEPLHVYSNIVNGVGIFSGSSASVDSSIVIPAYYIIPR